ncbi:hypothetical protein H6761_03735 [Candidatus Nomurabacteria bacterium]|nr:hypothetical protein [Candidatus Nomurabacteria bacterium]
MVFEQDFLEQAERRRQEETLFNERIGEFSPEDLELDDSSAPDNSGNYTKFDEKIRKVFPEISEDRFPAIKAAVTMHLCGF